MSETPAYTPPLFAGADRFQLQIVHLHFARLGNLDRRTRLERRANEAGEPLLFKGSDFSHTDIDAAVLPAL